jgi:hypothetical protein
MSSRLCPSLITPKDLIPLFVRPIDVLLSPVESLLRILLRKRAFLLRDPVYVSLSFKGSSDCLLSTIKTEDPWDLYPRRLAISLGSCYPLD